jgi:small subunit ribosomal protein S1
MKQAIPTGLDDFLLEHAAGDTVTGRIIDIDHLSNTARVELGEGIIAPTTLPAADPTDAPSTPPTSAGPVDLSQLGSLLSAKWKTADAHSKPAPKTSKPAITTGAIAPGQIRTFKITQLDAAAKKIALELA